MELGADAAGLAGWFGVRAFTGVATDAELAARERRYVLTVTAEIDAGGIETVSQLIACRNCFFTGEEQYVAPEEAGADESEQQ